MACSSPAFNGDVRNVANNAPPPDRVRHYLTEASALAGAARFAAICLARHFGGRS